VPLLFQSHRHFALGLSPTGDGVKQIEGVSISFW
jgi:hypothetical protein